MKNNKGFTLVEVVISFCILAFIFSAVLTAVLSFSHQLIESNELKRTVDSTFSDVQKETVPSKSNKSLSFHIGDKEYQQDIEIYKKTADKEDVSMQRFEAHVNYENNQDEETDETSNDVVSLHKIDTSELTYTVFDRMQFLDCVRTDGTKLNQGTYVSGRSYRVGDYVTYNGDIYLKVAKSGDWVSNTHDRSNKVIERQINDTLAPGNALSGWQLMSPIFDPDSTYLKGDLVVNHNVSWFGRLTDWLNNMTFNLETIHRFAQSLASDEIYCCDLKYNGSSVDAIGYSGSDTPYDAKGYTWTKVGKYSEASNVKTQYADWLRSNLKNAEIYGG